MADPGSNDKIPRTPDLAAEANLHAELVVEKRQQPQETVDADPNLAADGDAAEEDDLELTDDALPVFGTHADRDLG